MRFKGANQKGSGADKRLAEISDEEVIVLYIAIGNFKDNFQVAVSKRKELSDVLAEI